MPLPLILAPLVTFLLRDIIVKFLVFVAVFALIGFLVPYAVSFVWPFIGTSGLTYVFGLLGPGVWYFLDFFNLGYGVPICISAFVARFLIRRLPVIG